MLGIITLLDFITGWSSPVARLAHNQKAASSNLAPVTIYWHVAQLVVQAAVNRQVVGARPTMPANLQVNSLLRGNTCQKYPTAAGRNRSSVQGESGLLVRFRPFL